MFALGVLLLEVCSLRSSSELYDPETYNILDAGMTIWYLSYPGETGNYRWAVLLRKSGTANQHDAGI